MEGAHVFAHSRKDGKEGVCYIIINNSRTETTEVVVPECERYTLTAEHLRSQEIMLNGTPLYMEDETTMPELRGVKEESGTLTLPPCSVNYILV